MERTTIMLPPELKSKAAKYSELRGISLGQLIREALEKEVAQEAAIDYEADSFFSDNAVFHGDAPVDLSLRHDHYLYSEEFCSMAVYEYEHLGPACARGRVFEVVQSIHDEALAVCPECGTPVRRLISRVGICTPKGNSELRDLGFTKLVKRDDGVYENVTARDGESRYMRRGRPETLPRLDKTISD